MTTTPPAPTLTSTITPDPCPRVEVLVTPMPSDAATVTIWRTWAGQTRVVRGAIALPVAGDAFVIDYEVPVDGSVTYSCQTTDSAGNPSALSAPSAPMRLGLPEAWLQDPLDPTSALRVRLNSERGPSMVARQASFSALTFSQPASVSPVMGSTVPIGFGDVRQAASGIPIDLRVGVDDVPALRALLKAFVLCLRAPAPAVMLDPLTYVVLGDVTETWRPDLQSMILTSTAQAVMPPGSPIVKLPRTYLDLLGEASTYGDLPGLYATYLDVLRGQ